MIYEVSSVCEQGLVRASNQDAVLVRYGAGEGLFVVADGMGGHAKGDIASSRVAERLASWWERKKEDKSDFCDLVFDLGDEITSVSDELLREFSEEHVMGGTTVVALLIRDDRVAVLSAGDSRVYKMSVESEILELLTKDDVWQNSPEVAGVLSYEQMINNPQYGLITLAVGAMPHVTPHIRIMPLEKKDTFILCSDGIYRFCDHYKLNSMIGGLGKLKKASRLIEIISSEVVSSGAGDNYSAIIVRAGK